MNSRWRIGSSSSRGDQIRCGLRVMMQMLYLEDQKRGQLINLYINSPGGRGRHAGRCSDTMRFISSDVATYCIGRRYSEALLLLLSAGAEGRRHILPHGKVMIHQPYGGVYGQTSDVKIQAEQIVKSKETLNRFLPSTPGSPTRQWPRMVSVTSTSMPMRPRSTDWWTKYSSIPPIPRRTRLTVQVDASSIHVKSDTHRH